jgi:hypothetical protein
MGRRRHRPRPRPGRERLLPGRPRRRAARSSVGPHRGTSGTGRTRRIGPRSQPVARNGCRGGNASAQRTHRCSGARPSRTRCSSRPRRPCQPRRRRSTTAPPWHPCPQPVDCRRRYTPHLTCSTRRRRPANAPGGRYASPRRRRRIPPTTGHRRPARPTRPLVIRRVHCVVRGREIPSTREDARGLLRLEAGQLVAQWSTAHQTASPRLHTGPQRSTGRPYGNSDFLSRSGPAMACTRRRPS